MIIYFIEDEGTNPSKAFDSCNPGNIQDRGWLEQFSEGAIFTKKRWYEFSTGVRAAIDKRISRAESIDTSPILEAIEYVRATEFPPPGIIDANGNYRILLWSDMIQNSTTESHFAGMSEVRSVHAKRPVNLQYVQIYVFQITSEKYAGYQTPELVAWWRNFFALADADTRLWDKL